MFANIVFAGASGVPLVVLTRITDIPEVPGDFCFLLRTTSKVQEAVNVTKERTLSPEGPS